MHSCKHAYTFLQAYVVARMHLQCHVCWCFKLEANNRHCLLHGWYQGHFPVHLSNAIQLCIVTAKCRTGPCILCFHTYKLLQCAAMGKEPVQKQRRQETAWLPGHHVKPKNIRCPAFCAEQRGVQPAVHYACSQ